MSFRTDPASISGSIAPIVTPFTDDGSVDHDSLRGLVDWQLANGSDGISIGGSTGEPSAQTIAERAEAIRTVAAAVDGRVPFLPGTGTAKLDETLELTSAARDAGADMALVITPYYARPTQEAMYVWYSTVAREFPDLPIVAYNVPSRTAVELAPETIARLFRDLDNFVGVKETTKD
ncbi:MAG: dihydrodipicolinate synthase family protein, partial [Actinomycetaceae bacterium]